MQTHHLTLDVWTVPTGCNYAFDADHGHGRIAVPVGSPRPYSEDGCEFVGTFDGELTIPPLAVATFQFGKLKAHCLRWWAKE